MARRPAHPDVTHPLAKANGRNGQIRSHSEKPKRRSNRSSERIQSPRKAKPPTEARIVRSLTTDGMLVVRVPLAFARRSGRKRIITPDGTPLPTVIPPSESTALVKALARAHHWQIMMESGDYASLTELAAAEHVTPSYLARILRLTLLAPEVVESIMQQPTSMTTALAKLVRPFPTEWSGQKDLLI